MKFSVTSKRILSVLVVVTLVLNMLQTGLILPRAALASNADIPLTDKPAGDSQYSTENQNKPTDAAAGFASEPLLRDTGGENSPVIIEFLPVSGQAGDTVTITGANFTPDYPGDTAIDFNGIPAEVLSVTDTEVMVTVPLDAVSGLITVRTPAGKAVSPHDFTVTFLRSIQLQLTAGLNPQNYTIVNSHGFAVPDGNSTATIPSSDQDINFNCAISDADAGTRQDEPDERVFFQVDTLEAATNEAVTMNAVSTAKGMVFLSPYLFSPTMEKARLIMDIMETDPKVAILAQTIEEVYAETSSPLDDTRIETALQEAIRSVVDSIPEEYNLDLTAAPRVTGDTGARMPDFSTISDTAETPQPAEYIRQDGETLPIYWKPIDLYMMEQSIATGADGEEQPGRLSIEAVGDNPLDWIVRISELNPAQFSGGMSDIEGLATL